MQTRPTSKLNFPLFSIIELERGFAVKRPVDKIAWDVATVQISGTIKVNGEPPRRCDGTDPELEFLGDRGGYFSSTDVSDDGSFSAQLVPDVYRVRFIGPVGSASDIPCARMSAVVRSDLAVTESTDGLALRVKTVPISGTVTFADLATEETDCQLLTPRDALDGLYLQFLSDDGSVFYDSVSGWSNDSCRAPGIHFQSNVTPGTYRVLAAYPPLELGPDWGGMLVLQTGLVVSAHTKKPAWKVGLVEVSGTVLLDGVASCGTASVKLVNDDGAEFEAFGSGCDASGDRFKVRATPGTYRVLANLLDGGNKNTGANGTALVRTGFTIEQPIDGLVWDVKTVQVAGTIAIDGKPPASEPHSRAELVKVAFIGATGAIFIGYVYDDSPNGAWSTRVAPGTYRVVASRLRATTASFPLQSITLQDALIIR